MSALHLCKDAKANERWAGKSNLEGKQKEKIEDRKRKIEMQPCRREIRVNRGGGVGNSQAGAQRGMAEQQRSSGPYLHGG